MSCLCSRDCWLPEDVWQHPFPVSKQYCLVVLCWRDGDNIFAVRLLLFPSSCLSCASQNPEVLAVTAENTLGKLECLSIWYSAPLSVQGQCIPVWDPWDYTVMSVGPCFKKSQSGLLSFQQMAMARAWELFFYSTVLYNIKKSLKVNHSFGSSAIHHCWLLW